MFGGFGNNQPSGSFGNNQPTGGFGSNQPTSGFGNNQPAGGFGNNQPTGGFGPSGGFGNNGASGFGQPSGGFGNNQPSGGFGNNGGSSSFGNNPPTSGFGNNGGSGFGSSQPTGSTFGKQNGKGKGKKQGKGDQSSFGGGANSMPFGGGAGSGFGQQQSNTTPFGKAKSGGGGFGGGGGSPGGGFGQQQSNTTPFGKAKSGGGGFGGGGGSGFGQQQSNATPFGKAKSGGAGFGGAAGSGFGQQQSNATPFGKAKSGGAGFGGAAGSGFGQQQSNATPFGKAKSGGGGFGGGAGSGFGQQQSNTTPFGKAKSGGAGFGGGGGSPGGGFGQQQSNTTPFGKAKSGGGGFDDSSNSSNGSPGKGRGKGKGRNKEESRQGKGSSKGKGKFGNNSWRSESDPLSSNTPQFGTAAVQPFESSQSPGWQRSTDDMDVGRGRGAHQQRGKGKGKGGDWNRSQSPQKATGKMKVTNMPQLSEKELLSKLTEICSPFGTLGAIKVFASSTPPYAWVNFSGEEGGANADTAATTLNNTDVFRVGQSVFFKSSGKSGAPISAHKQPGLSDASTFGSTPFKQLSAAATPFKMSSATTASTSHNKLDNINLADLRRSRQSMGSSSAYAVGDRVSALYREDGEWYSAVVTRCGAKGYSVKFEEFDGYQEHGKAESELLPVPVDEEEDDGEEELEEEEEVEDDDPADEDYEEEGEEEEECAAGCGLLVHRSPPSNFTDDDMGYCCRKCRQSSGMKHEGQCESRPVGTFDQEQEEESDDPWSSTSLSSAKYSSDKKLDISGSSVPSMKKSIPLKGLSAPASSTVSLKASTSGGETQVLRNPEVMSKRADRFATPVANRPSPPSLKLSPPAQSLQAKAPRQSSTIDHNTQPSSQSSGEQVIVGQCEEMSYITDPRSIRDRFEAGFEEFGLSWKETACKQHKRSAAGYVWDPLEVRTDAALSRTVQFIIDSVADVDTKPNARIRKNFNGSPYTLEVWKYAWNRLRAVRVDFKIQGYFGVEPKVTSTAVDAYELMARFHLSLHAELQGCEVFDRDRESVRAAGGNVEMVKFEHSDKNSREAIQEILTELQQLYETAISHSDVSLLGSGGLNSMAQCIGYMVLYNMENDDGMWLSSFIRKLSQSNHITGILDSRPFKFAISVCVARLRRDFYAFFRLLKAAPYVEACIMTKYLDCSNPRSDGGMRYIAIRALHKTWSGGPKSSKNPVPLSMISDMLCLEEDDCIDLVQQFGLNVVQGSDGDDDGLSVEFCREHEFEGYPHSQKSIEDLTAARKYESFVLKKRNPVSGELVRDPETGNFIFEISRARIARDKDIEPSIPWHEAGLSHISAAAAKLVGAHSLSAHPQVNVVNCRSSIAQVLIKQSGLVISSGQSNNTSSSSFNMFAQSEASRQREEKARQAVTAKNEADQQAAQEKAHQEKLAKQNELLKAKIKKDQDILEAQRLADLKREQQEQERLVREKQEEERLAKEKREEERLRVLKAEAEKKELLAQQKREAENKEKIRLEAEQESIRIAQEKKRLHLLSAWNRLQGKATQADRRKQLTQGKKSIIRCIEGSYKVKLMLCWTKWRKLKQTLELRRQAMGRAIADIDVSIEPLISHMTNLHTSSIHNAGDNVWTRRAAAHGQHMFTPSRHPSAPLRGSMHQPALTSSLSSQGHGLVSRRREREEEGEETETVEQETHEQEVNAFKALADMKAPQASQTVSTSKRMRISDGNHGSSLDSSDLSTNFRTPKKISETQTPSLTPMSWASVSQSKNKSTPHQEMTFTHMRRQVTNAAEMALEARKRLTQNTKQVHRPVNSYLDAVRGVPQNSYPVGSAQNETSMHSRQRMVSQAANESKRFEKRLKAMASIPTPGSTPSSHKNQTFLAPSVTPIQKSSRDSRKLEDQLFEAKLKELLN